MLYNFIATATVACL